MPHITAGSSRANSVVIANNDVVYIWWSVPEKIEKCLGFSIHRIVDGHEELKGLKATVGFDVQSDPRESPQTTDEWPLQTFNWKDLYAPHDEEVKYRIIPMIGEWNALEPDLDNSIITNAVKRTQTHNELQVIFNRGLLSTQAFSKRGGVEGVNSQRSAREILTDPDNEWRKRLAGQMLYNIKQFFKKGKEAGGKFYAALYELSDKELIKHLTDADDIEIILSNANGSQKVLVDGVEKTKTVNDKTNAKTRKALHALKEQGKLILYDRMLGSHIGHNKFVIYVDASGDPQSVLTGSTNWTSTGLCGQTNNMLFIHSPGIAATYLDYWQQLQKDTNQHTDLRSWCEKNTSDWALAGKGKLTLWFSPNTELKNKPARDAETPVDMQVIYELIEKAKKSVLFLLFNPGSPSILQQIKEVAEKRPQNKPLYVRGAISDAKIARQVITDIYSRDVDARPDRYVVTGVGAIPGPFSYFEKELLKLGHSTIHDKVLVIDPFEKDCVVITGSHNLGFRASYCNDENMVIIRGDSGIAKAYAAHVLDVVNHFKWRYKLQEKTAKAKTEAAKKKILEREWNDLDEKDKWMDAYFGPQGFKSRDKLFLPQA